MSTGQDLTSVSYTGERGAIFKLALRTGLLTILTLGIYRFWAKTRIRRYVWSSIRLGDDTLEYTGTGAEKFKGFLVATVILAVYLGLVQLALFYFGMRFVFEPRTRQEAIMQVAVFYLSVLAVLPLMIFARYRSLRYRMARTRFRGIRFGMDHAAWGYVWRAIGHGLLTIVTLGLLLPRQTFWLTKYKTDRSWYGDQRFVQGGRWTKLYPGMAGWLLTAVLAALLIGLAAKDMRDGMAEPGMVFVLLRPVSLIVGAVSYVHYRVRSFRYLTSNTLLAGAVGFQSEPRTKRVVAIYVLGSLATVTIISAAFALATGVVTATMGVAVGTGAAPGFVGFGAIAALYLGALALAGAASLAFVTQPLIAHLAGTLTVANAEALDPIRQRAFDRGADAEGFADALDVGAAI